MLLGQVDQDRKDHGGGGRGGIEILVLDGGIDAGIRRFLNGLQNREKPSQGVGDIHRVRIELHLQNLLRYVGVFTAAGLGQLQIVRLQDGRPAPGDLPLRPDPQGYAVEQGGGIGGVVQNRPQHLPRQVRGRGLIPGVLVHRFAKQPPNRQPFKLVIGGTDDLQAVIMGLDIFQKGAEGIAQEEPHRQPGGVGGKAQDIELHLRVQPLLLKLHRIPPAELLHHAPQLPFLIGRVGLSHGGKAEKGLVGVAASPGPAHYGGVPDAADMVPVGQQMVQGGGVGEGGIFPGGGVQILLLSIGAEGRGVEGHQGGTAGLGPGHVFDGGMDALHRAGLPGDQADAPGPVAGMVVMGFPGCPHRRVLMDEAPVRAEDQVAPGEKLVQLLRQGGVLPGGLRLPGAEKTQHRPGRRGIHPRQDPFMEGLAGFEALPAPPGPALAVDAQDVAGIVPEEVGGYSDGTLHRRREGNDLGGQHRLVPPRLLGLDADDPLQGPVLPDAQGEGHLHRAPARGGDLSPVVQNLIVIGQGLEDHPRTSPLSRAGTFSTPFSSDPRKNRGWMSSGSE